MEWYRLQKLYHSIFLLPFREQILQLRSVRRSCNGKGIDFFCQGRIASAPDKRNPIVGGGCNTPATMGYYREFRRDHEGIAVVGGENSSTTLTTALHPTAGAIKGETLKSLSLISEMICYFHFPNPWKWLFDQIFPGFEFSVPYCS